MPPRRPDFSPHIVHLTRDYLPRTSLRRTSARDNIFSILADRRIEARTAYGIAVRHLEAIGCDDRAFMDSQKVACFSETPMAHLSHLIDPGQWRRGPQTSARGPPPSPRLPSVVSFDKIREPGPARRACGLSRS